MTRDNVKKVNEKVAGRLIDWLIAMIKCHDLLPQAKLMNDKLNQLFIDLERNQSSATDMENTKGHLR